MDNVLGIFHDTAGDTQSTGFITASKGATTVTGSGTILRGEDVILATSSLVAFDGATIDFEDSTLYLNGDYSARFAMDSRNVADNGDPATYRWVRGKIIMSGVYTATDEIDVFLRFRAVGGTLAVPVFTGTQFIRQIQPASNNNYPGFNMTGVPAGADITGASFDGWWVNFPADLPTINVDFSRVGIRNSPSGVNPPYSIRFNARSNASTNQMWLNGSDFSGVGGIGTTGGNRAGGTFTNSVMEIFGSGTTLGGYEHWFVDNVLPVPRWAASTSYAVGDLVDSPTDGNRYRVTQTIAANAANTDPGGTADPMVPTNSYQLLTAAERVRTGIPSCTTIWNSTYCRSC